MIERIEQNSALPVTGNYQLVLKCHFLLKSVFVVGLTIFFCAFFCVFLPPTVNFASLPTLRVR